MKRERTKPTRTSGNESTVHGQSKQSLAGDTGRLVGKEKKGTSLHPAHQPRSQPSSLFLSWCLLPGLDQHSFRHRTFRQLNGHTHTQPHTFIHIHSLRGKRIQWSLLQHLQREREREEMQHETRDGGSWRSQYGGRKKRWPRRNTIHPERPDFSHFNRSLRVLSARTRRDGFCTHGAAVDVRTRQKAPGCGWGSSRAACVVDFSCRYDVVCVFVLCVSRRTHRFSQPESLFPLYSFCSVGCLSCVPLCCILSDQRALNLFSVAVAASIDPCHTVPCLFLLSIRLLLTQ